jgi:hypothetical protein
MRNKATVRVSGGGAGQVRIRVWREVPSPEHAHDLNAINVGGALRHQRALAGRSGYAPDRHLHLLREFRAANEHRHGRQNKGRPEQAAP